MAELDEIEVEIGKITGETDLEVNHRLNKKFN